MAQVCFIYFLKYVYEINGGRSHLHVSSPPPEAQQLLVLAGDKVDGSVLQQRREDEEQAHGHPDVDGLDVGHLGEGGGRKGERFRPGHAPLCDWVGSPVGGCRFLARVSILSLELHLGKKTSLHM